MIARFERTEVFAQLVVVTVSVFTLAIWCIPGLATLGPPILSRMVPGTALGMLLAVGSSVRDWVNDVRQETRRSEHRIVAAAASEDTASISTAVVPSLKASVPKKNKRDSSRS